jgi:hypothetical protein
MDYYTPQLSEDRSEYEQKAAIPDDHPSHHRSGWAIQNAITEVFPQPICNGLILHV